MLRSTKGDGMNIQLIRRFLEGERYPCVSMLLVPDAWFEHLRIRTGRGVTAESSSDGTKTIKWQSSDNQIAWEKDIEVLENFPRFSQNRLRIRNLDEVTNQEWQEGVIILEVEDRILA